VRTIYFYFLGRRHYKYLYLCGGTPKKWTNLFYSEIYLIHANIIFTIINTLIFIYRTVFKLLASPSEKLRIQAVKLLGFFLMRAAHK
jgi:hypothetical protein